MGVAARLGMGGVSGLAGFLDQKRKVVWITPPQVPKPLLLR